MIVFLFVVLQYVLVFTGGTVIEREDSRDPPFNITGEELSAKTFRFPDHELAIVYYIPGETQVSLVINLPYLTHLNIDGVGQKRLPIFKNLPRIYEISIENNKIETVTSESFSSTPVQDVFLDNNYISKVEDGSFGKEVKRVSLICNSMTKVDQKWFTNPSNLEELDLSGNKVEVIEKNFFKKFTSLQTILLSHNRLKVLGDGIFSNRDHFYMIRIDHNSLTELKPTIFQEGNVTVDFLDISHNNISFLYRGLRDKLKLSMRPRIGGNPWQCPCYQQIKQWRPTKTVEYYPRDPPAKPKCISLEKSDKCIELVEQEILESYAKATTLKPVTREHVCGCLHKTKEDTYNNVVKCYGP